MEAPEPADLPDVARDADGDRGAASARLRYLNEQTARIASTGSHLQYGSREGGVRA